LAYLNRGNAKLANDDDFGAIDDYSRAIEINPKNADSYYNRASAKKESMDYNGAIADYDLVFKLSPFDGEAYCSRGHAKNILGYKVSACMDYKKAKELGCHEAIDSIKCFCKKPKKWILY